MTVTSKDGWLFKDEGRMLTWAEYENKFEPGKKEGFYCSYLSLRSSGAEDDLKVATFIGSDLDLG